VAGYTRGKPRSIWNGSLSFGHVNVPVQLFSATDEKDIHFNQFEKGTGKRIHYKRVAEDSDEEVAYKNIVKGYEVSDGKFVIVTPEELESVEPGKSRTIDIEDFIDLAEIDPVYFEKSYYLAPQEGAGADRAYALLRDAMAKAGKVAIGRFVMRTKQYLACVRTGEDDVLVLETMFFPDEVRAAGDLPSVPTKRTKPSERELKVADQLIRSLSSEWDPSKYHDTYRQRVLDLIKRKAEGEEIVVEEREPEETNVVDLMAALEASLAAAKGEKPKKVEGRATDKWSKMTKSELEKAAAKKDVSGRSKMTKDELVDALRDAS
jgi:DNA end-binding protein Ku